jgi:hypothetical protein
MKFGEERTTTGQIAQNLLIGHTCKNCQSSSNIGYCYFAEFDKDGTEYTPHKKIYKTYGTCKDWSFYDNTMVYGFDDE